MECENIVCVGTESDIEGKLSPDTGEITWDLTLASQQQKELKLVYEVRYPKRESIVLE